MARNHTDSARTESAQEAGTPGYSGQPERRPFLRLEPRAAEPMTDEILETLPALRRELYPELPGLARAVVDHSVRFQNAQSRRQPRTTPTAISLPMLNRRRRAARLWLQAILYGRVDPVTRHAVAHQWLPQLAGVTADGTTPPTVGRRFLEFVRGLLIASVADRPSANLVPIAKQMFAIESVLSVHLGAFAAVSRRRATRAQADQAVPAPVKS